MDDARGSIALACGLLLITIAVALHHAPRQTFVVGSVMRLEPGRMLVDVEYSDQHEPRWLEVVYRGPLPANVCAPYEIAVTGDVVGTALVADEIRPVNTGKYDGCFRWRCSGRCPDRHGFQ